MVKHLIAEDVKREIERLDTAIGAVRPSIDELIERGDVAHPASIATCSKPSACSRTTAAGCGACAKRSRPASPPKPRSSACRTTPAPSMHAPDRALSARAPARSRRSRQPAAAPAGRRATSRRRRTRCPTTPSSSPAPWGRRRCSTMTAPACAASCSRRAAPTSHVAIVARALGIPAVGEVDNITSMVESGDAIIVDGATGDVQVRPQPDVEAAYAEKARLRARRQEQYRELRDVPAVTRDGVKISLNMNAGPAGRPAASRRDRRGRHRPVPHRAAVHGRGALAATREQEQLYAARHRRGRRHARHLPHPRHRRRQDPALHADAWTRRIRRSAGAPSASASTGRGCCARRCAPCCKAAGGPRIKIMFPMIATVDEFAARQGHRRARDGASASATAIQPPRRPRLGVMVEVPSLLFQLDEICPRPISSRSARTT